MRILVTSDTHGSYEHLIEQVRKEKFDMHFHLGDYVEDGEMISQALGLPTHIIKGNGDFQRNYLDEEVLTIKGKRILLTHGHLYYIRNNLTDLYYRARELELDLILFGHIHIPINLKEDGILYFNPGSPSYPRGLDRKKTYGILQIDEQIHASIVELD